MDQETAQKLLEKTRDDYNLIAEEFSRTRQNLWSELFTIFQDYIKDGDKVLDVGCGNGRLLDLFGQKRMEYTGIDNAERQLKEAQKKYPDRKFLVADVLDLPFLDNSFDKIFLIAVLHHLPDKERRQKALRESQRVLKPGGLLFISVWRPRLAEVFGLILKYSFLKIVGKSKMDWFDVLIPWGSRVERYYHLFRQSELLDLVKNLGFKVTRAGIARNKTGQRSNLYLIAQRQ
jgi:ubiquinone/menaquinone biosynthesis C-methylase UbiE